MVATTSPRRSATTGWSTLKASTTSSPAWVHHGPSATRTLLAVLARSSPKPDPSPRAASTHTGSHMDSPNCSSAAGASRNTRDPVVASTGSRKGSAPSGVEANSPRVAPLSGAHGTEGKMQPKVSTRSSTCSSSKRGSTKPIFSNTWPASEGR